MTGRMTGRQEVVGSFDLESFVGGADGPPPSNKPKAEAKPTVEAKPAIKEPEPKPAAKAKSKPEGRPKKPAKDALTERAQILLSPAEMAKVKEKAGLANTSTFLRKYLQDTGLI